MADLQGMIQWSVYALMGICVFWALCAVTLRSLFHAALAFTAVLLGIAGIYISLHAEFLAVVQVLVYVGAVMTIIIFAIMLTERFTDTKIKQSNGQSWIGLLGGAFFIGVMVKIILRTPWPMAETVHENISALEIGKALLNIYVFPFEVLAIILTAVLIGALVIAKKENTP